MQTININGVQVQGVPVTITNTGGEGRPPAPGMGSLELRLEGKEGAFGLACAALLSSVVTFGDIYGMKAALHIIKGTL